MKTKDIGWLTSDGAQVQQRVRLTDAGLEIDGPMRIVEPRGLGDSIANATAAIGIKPCGGCKKRQRFLNRLFPRRTQSE